MKKLLIAALILSFLNLPAGVAKDAPLKPQLPKMLIIGDYNFLYASGWLLVISVAVIVVVSLLTKPPSLEQIENLTYSTATQAQRKENRQSWNKWDVIATAVVLGLVLAMYLYFTFWLR